MTKMKNLNTYVKKEINRLSGFEYDVAKEATEKVLATIEKNVELGNIKNLDERTVDYIIFRIIDSYH